MVQIFITQNIGEQAEPLDLLFDPVYENDIHNNETLMTNKIDDTLERLDKISSYPALLSTFWNSGMPCSDSEENSILRYCEWKGEQVPCSAIFSTFPTDQGMCCTFNMKAAEQLFLGTIQIIRDTFYALFRTPPPLLRVTFFSNLY
jgi:hypothetical protein